MSSPEDPASRPAVPQYGEYAEPGDPRFAPPPAAAAPTPTPASPPARRSREAILSAVLIAIGFLSTLNTVFFSLDLEAGLRMAYTVYGGTGDYEPAANIPLVQAVLIGSHVILFVAALRITRSRIRAGRTSFWVPLAAGAIAAVVLFSTFAVILRTDDALYAVMLAWAGS